jgi:hypothetical protein
MAHLVFIAIVLACSSGLAWLWLQRRCRLLFNMSITGHLSVLRNQLTRSAALAFFLAVAWPVLPQPAACVLAIWCAVEAAVGLSRLRTVMHYARAGLR